MLGPGGSALSRPLVQTSQMVQVGDIVRDVVQILQMIPILQMVQFLLTILMVQGPKGSSKSDRLLYKM